MWKSVKEKTGICSHQTDCIARLEVGEILVMEQLAFSWDWARKLHERNTESLKAFYTLNSVHSTDISSYYRSEALVDVQNITRLSITLFNPTVEIDRISDFSEL